MKLQRKIINLFIMVVTIIEIVSCSFLNNKINSVMLINDISTEMNYVTVISQGYMGGSLIYNESNENLGHLANGVSVAIRLSKIQRFDINDNESVFQEQSGSAIYGLLTINEIKHDKISLETELYDSNGNIYLKKSVFLNKNEVADLNEDGLADIQYVEPFSKRYGYEKSMYLTFLSSQEDLNITMYAVLPEQYPGQTYPNGIIGVNNDDKFIVQKYINSNTEQRSVISGIYKGDYIVDNKNNKYQKVANNQYARHARRVSDDDLIDLEEDEDIINTVFHFTEEDFAFSTSEDFINVLPKKLVTKYESYFGLEKLNKILEDKELFKIIDEEQGSILLENDKEEIFKQFENLSIEETIQLNRVFLEKNYPISCPQRVTVSTVITEVLPLASIVFTEVDIYENVVEDTSSCNTIITGNESRAASSSFVQCKSEDDYQNKLKNLQCDFDSYKKIFSHNNFEGPAYKDNIVNVNLSLKNSEIAVGIKGSLSSVFGSVKSSLGAAAFFKVGADIGVNIINTLENDNLASNYEGNKINNQIKQVKKTFPIVNKDITIFEFELCQSTNLVNFAIGPIVIGINLDLGIGLPLKTEFEMDCEISYSAFIAGIAKAGISVGVDYGVNWRKKWIISIPIPYINWSGNASASADAICYFEQNFETQDFNLSKLSLQFSIEPYVKAGLSMSVAAIVHADCGLRFGTKGYLNFGYYQPYLRISYGLNDSSSIYANAYLGLKGLKIFGIKIGGAEKHWDWELLDFDKTIIPETILYEYKIN